ncbi:hypothetical protein I4F81_005791 [Pyropia yezoensis]|uniref:Uncharacterized protein n=1 Tax=Pyropia yezoensis TaxID=2788 RepID=A0ACC3C0A4_PYRYE|nr:hypothetical protein I4F81_005791 [Neopyropia yezoensis]
MALAALAAGVAVAAVVNVGTVVGVVEVEVAVAVVVVGVAPTVGHPRLQCRGGEVGWGGAAVAAALGRAPPTRFGPSSTTSARRPSWQPRGAGGGEGGTGRGDTTGAGGGGEGVVRRSGRGRGEATAALSVRAARGERGGHGERGGKYQRCPPGRPPRGRPPRGVRAPHVKAATRPTVGAVRAPISVTPVSPPYGGRACSEKVEGRRGDVADVPAPALARPAAPAGHPRPRPCGGSGGRDPAHPRPHATGRRGPFLHPPRDTPSSLHGDVTLAVLFCPPSPPPQLYTPLQLHFSAPPFHNDKRVQYMVIKTTERCPPPPTHPPCSARPPIAPPLPFRHTHPLPPSRPPAVPPPTRPPAPPHRDPPHSPKSVTSYCPARRGRSSSSLQSAARGRQPSPPPPVRAGHRRHGGGEGACACRRRRRAAAARRRPIGAPPPPAAGAPPHPRRDGAAAPAAGADARLGDRAVRLLGGEERVEALQAL